jgi:hypothetical protein
LRVEVCDSNFYNLRVLDLEKWLARTSGAPREVSMRNNIRSNSNSDDISTATSVGLRRNLPHHEHQQFSVIVINLAEQAPELRKPSRVSTTYQMQFCLVHFASEDPAASEVLLHRNRFQY